MTNTSPSPAVAPEAAPVVRVLTRGSNAWRLTRFADDHFVAVNNQGKTKEYTSEAGANSFWDFLVSVGYRLREDKWSLATVVKHPVDASEETPDQAEA